MKFLCKCGWTRFTQQDEQPVTYLPRCPYRRWWNAWRHHVWAVHEPAPPRPQNGYLAIKPCGCAVQWMSFGMTGDFLTKTLEEWRARGWTVGWGTSEALAYQPPCTHTESVSEPEGT